MRTLREACKALQSDHARSAVAISLSGSPGHEAVHATFLKKVHDARKDGNPILAIVRPSGAADTEIDFTLTGGSEATSGISVLVKAVLSLERETIPSNTHILAASDKAMPAVTTHPTKIPASNVAKLRIASRSQLPSSFSLVCTDCPLLKRAPVLLTSDQVVEPAPKSYCISSPGTYRPELLLFSADNRTSLSKQIQHHHQYIQSHDIAASDLAYTRAMRREALDYRAFCTLQKNHFVNISSHVRSQKQFKASIMIVFSGQGAQWAGMGKELVQLGAGVVRDIEIMDKALRSIEKPPSWTIKGIVSSLQKLLNAS